MWKCFKLWFVRNIKRDIKVICFNCSSPNIIQCWDDLPLDWWKNIHCGEQSEYIGCKIVLYSSFANHYAIKASVAAHKKYLEQLEFAKNFNNSLKEIDKES